MSAIERKAVWHFGTLLEKSCYLESSIDHGEKGKITDGYIHIFRSPRNRQGDHSLRDGNYFGRLDVQVKGKTLPRNKTFLSSFELTRSELENFEHVGGVVLLVAGIPRNDLDPIQSYYADLAQSNVRLILNSMGKNQSTKSVPLKRFPSEPNEVLQLIRHLQTRQSEKSIVTPSASLIDDADGITVTTPSTVDWSQPQFFGGPSSSAIISTSGPRNESQVIDAILEITPESYQLHRNEKFVIECGGVRFSDTRKRKLSNDEWELHVSPGILIKFNGTQTIDVTVRTRNILFFAIKDLRFLQALTKSEWITVNGERFARFTTRDSNLENFLKPLGFLSDLEKILGHFNVDTKAVKVSDLPEETIQSLNRLAQSIIHAQPIHYQVSGPLREQIHFAESRLELVWRDEGSNHGLVPYSLFDSSKLRYCAPLGTANDKEHQIENLSAFEFFGPEDLSKILNLNPGSIIRAYESIDESLSNHFANMTVLKLIQAADITPRRRIEFLKMAMSLNDWLLDRFGLNVTQLLNRFQIKFRLSSLNDDDVSVLEEIRQESRNQKSTNNLLANEIAAAILLGMHDGAEYLMSNMPSHEKKQFEEWPIYFLHKHRAEPYVLNSTSDEEGWRVVEQQLEKDSIERLNNYRRGMFDGAH